MNTIILICICIVVVASLLAILFLVTSGIFFNKIYIPYKNAIEHEGISELYTTLNVIIENEISIYENSVFANGGKIVTEQTFDKFYKNIMNRIEESLSDNILLGKFCPYLKEEAVIRLIARIVKTYLTNKIM